MRIGIDARSLSEAHPSGISLYTYHIVQAMAQVAPEHTYVLFTSGSHQPTSLLLQLLLADKHIEHHHLHLPNKIFHGLAMLGLGPRIDTVLPNIDLLFAPNMHIMPLDSAVPLVMVWHDVSYRMYRQFLSLRRKLWHTVVRPQTLAEQATRIIAVSNITKNDISREHHIDPSKITVVHSAIPQTPVNQSTTLSSIQLPERYFAMITTIEPRKNIAAVLAAYQLYEQTTSQPLDLVIAGSAGWKSNRLITMMQQHPRIHYMSYISEQDKANIYRQATALLYPSIYEGFGFPPLEAMQHRVPVIASWAGALPEVLDNAAYYIQPYSITEIAQAMHEMHTNTRLRHYYIQQQPAVLQRYSWQQSAAATLKVLHSAIY